MRAKVQLGCCIVIESRRLSSLNATSPALSVASLFVARSSVRTGEPMKEWEKKQREFEQVKARAKALRLRLTCTICGAKPKTLLNCPCGTTQCAPASS